MKQGPVTLVLASAVMLAWSQAFSEPIPPLNILSEYTLTSWGQKDGLPASPIRAIAQDRTGYLWLGTDAGLLAFDGVHFATWRNSDGDPLPRASVRAVIVSSDGSIWVGFDEPGGVSQIRGGTVRNFGAAQGLPSKAVTAFLESPDGTIWAGTDGGLYTFSDGIWTPSGDGLPSALMYDLHVDQSGRFLAATAVGLFGRDEGESSFHPMEAAGRRVRGIAESQTGTVWVADSATGFRELRSDDAWRSPAEIADGSRLLYDSNGDLWVGTYGQGIWRVVLGPRPGASIVQKTTTLTGLSADGVTALLEDRDGNVWVATNDGLNRFTPHRVTPVLNLGVIYGVEATPDGGVWVGSVDALLEFTSGSVVPARTSLPLDGAPPSAMHAGDDGTLWVATGRNLLRFRDGRWSTIPLPAPGPRPLASVTAIASAPDGGLWLYDDAEGLFRWTNGRLDAARLPSDLQRVAIVCSLSDRNGVLWLSFADGHVASLDESGTTLYPQRDPSPGDVFRAMYADDSGVLWLGGSKGLSRIVDGRLQALGDASGIAPGAVISIMQDDQQAFWFGLEGSGVLQVDKHELDEAFAHSTYQVHSAFFDKVDGFAGSPRWFGNSTAAKSSDGRLWFLSGRGVSIIDPSTLRPPPNVPSQIRIDEVLASGQEVAGTSGALSLPQRERLEFRYSLATLTYPLRTQFRYRLDGFDVDWIDAGLERQAVYANLPPRQYRFRVVARTSDGVWPEEGATLAFSVPPRFYQTIWFRSSGVVALFALVAAIWRLHLRGVRKQFLVLLAERTRLSREIHDTVLQGLCGIGLQCDVIAHDPAVTAPAIRDRLLRLRDQAEEYAREARQSVLDLRSPKLDRCDLAEVLRQSGTRAIAGTDVRLDVSVTGVPFEGSSTANEQLLRITQEAIANSVRHGQATEVRIDLVYGDASLLLKVSDNGEGFEPDAVRTNDGHYGLTNMKERAEGVKGTLTIRSHPGGGTDLEVIVPRHPSM